MKKELALTLLLVLITGFSIRERHDGHSSSSGHGGEHGYGKYPPLTKKFILEFDHAARETVAFESNKFAVEWNGKRIKEWTPVDYKIHHQKIKLKAKVGQNSLHFIGTGTSDTGGHGIDNVKLHRKSFCGYEDVIINGGFQQGHTLGNSFQIFANGVITGWTSANNQIEVGWGRIYNQNWPQDTHILELDAFVNTDISQKFNLDKWYRRI